MSAYTVNEIDYEIRLARNAISARSPYIDRGRYGTDPVVSHIERLLRNIQINGIKGWVYEETPKRIVEELSYLLEEAKVIEKQYLETKASKKFALGLFNRRNFLYRFFQRKTKKRLEEELAQLDPERIKR